MRRLRRLIPFYQCRPEPQKPGGPVGCDGGKLRLSRRNGDVDQMVSEGFPVRLSRLAGLCCDTNERRALASQKVLFQAVRQRDAFRFERIPQTVRLFLFFVCPGGICSDHRQQRLIIQGVDCGLSRSVRIERRRGAESCGDDRLVHLTREPVAV